MLLTVIFLTTIIFIAIKRGAFASAFYAILRTLAKIKNKNKIVPIKCVTILNPKQILIEFLEPHCKYYIRCVSKGSRFWVKEEGTGHCIIECDNNIYGLEFTIYESPNSTRSN